jgi:CDP-diacylglycerol--glycerol-3-phosphate 3-phosphatidyltransferase
MHLPNLLTLLRIMLTPIICWGMCWHTPAGMYMSSIVFFIAAITDFADGYVAEKYNARSVLGAALDPLADKLLVVLVLFFLAATGRLSGPWMFWPCSWIIAREILVLGLRSMIGAERLPVIGMAKAKTFLQMISIGLLINDFALYPWTYGMTMVVLWTSAILSASSAYVYFRHALKIYQREHPAAGHSKKDTSIDPETVL